MPGPYYCVACGRRPGRRVSSAVDWRTCLLLSGLGLGVLAALVLGLNGTGEVGVSLDGKETPRRAERGWVGSSLSVDTGNGTGLAGKLDAEDGEVPDAALVERVRKGDARAFAALVRRHIRAVHQVAMSVVGDRDLADDVSQDAFLLALKRIEQCRDPERFRSWLLSIARNQARNKVAYEGVRSAVSLEAAGQPRSHDDPQRQLEEREFREELDTAVGALKGLKKEVFLLHDVKGWSHGEISRQLGISTGASRVHLHMARRFLRGTLTRFRGEEA